jgi:carbohydrate kinase (thermoresistant glucokinase family)
VILIVSGPAGTGKTTVGALVAGNLHWEFADADAFHTPAGKAKMRAGTPLTDEDRWPWLEAIGDWIDEREAAGASGVVTCSALRRAYREKLLEGRPDVLMVFLNATREELHDRLASRPGHFFPEKLLESQLSALELPVPDERVPVVPSSVDPGHTAEKVMQILKPAARSGHCTGLVLRP